MVSIEDLIRPHVRALKPYATARDEFKGNAEIFLDANENPHGSVIHGPYSRYPDPHQKKLKAALSQYRSQPIDSIFIGHGSDECIELLIRVAGIPEKKSVVVMPPTYSMYQISSEINNVGVTEVALNPDFSVNVSGVISALNAEHKILFVCSPNNPSGNAQSLEAISSLCERFPGFVVVDEAYSDFCPEKSALSLRERFKNLVVIQTFSKAWGLPALRLGVLYGDPLLCGALAKIKPPYNVGGIEQQLAVRAIARAARMESMVGQIVRDREWLRGELLKMAGVRAVEPSDANFLLVRFQDARHVYKGLLERGIVVRDRSNQLHCDGGLRISVGTPRENIWVLKALAEILSVDGPREKPQGTLFSRRAIVSRNTNETKIVVDINLDGSGESYCSTGIGFLDHMLDQMARHSGIDLSVSVDGDLNIDEHHTTEDLAIVLGGALREALGDKRGIERYGFVAPMDEAQASVALDFSGRAYLVFHAEFKREYVGDMPTEMVKHFFHSLTESADITLHIEAHGENEHHLIEAIFKGFARALRMAIARSGSDSIPSTKGSL